MFGNGAQIFMTKVFMEVIVFFAVVAGAITEGALWQQLEEEVIPFLSK